MSEAPRLLPGTFRAPRHLGVLRGPAPGRTLVVVAGVHGNEPAGVQGAYRALQGLRALGGPRAGEVVVLVGNRTALAEGVRFVDTDLNRIWGEGGEGFGSAGSVEAREARELAGALEAAARRSRGPVHVLDLHTTSSDGGAFTAASRQGPGRTFAAQFHVPVVLGLGDRLDGTLLHQVERRGWTGAVLEAGRHDDSASVVRAEAGVWLAAGAAGLLPRGGPLARRARWARRSLRLSTRGLPKVVEVRHRQAVAESDTLRLDPGLHNFVSVRAGDRLGSLRGDPVRAPEDGLLLMPLYQAVGTDGFFVVRPVASGRLDVVSAARRWLGFERGRCRPGRAEDPR